MEYSFVTIVEIHTLNIDICVCLKESFFFSTEHLLRYNLVYIEKYDQYTLKSKIRFYMRLVIQVK